MGNSKIADEDIEKAKKIIENIDFRNRNQTLKILKKHFYQRSSNIDKFLWEDKPERIYQKDLREIDIDTIADILVNIAIYLSAFNQEGFMTAEYDLESDYQLEYFLINELGLKKIHPFLDKIIASSVQYVINEYSDLSDENEILEKLSYFTINLIKKLSLIDFTKFRKDTDAQQYAGDLDVGCLEQGQVVKNYKELCKLLNQKVLAGNSRAAQLKEFQRYFEYQKVGNKFLITYIFDEPLPKDDKRSNGNNSIYVKYIETILLKYMSAQTNYTCTFTKRNLWLLLGMINENYARIPMSELQKLDWSDDVPHTYISTMKNNFYFRCNNILTRILFSALKNLRKRRLISYYEQTVIVENNRRFVATDNQLRIIDRIEKSVLDEMGFIDVTQVYCRYKTEEFYKKVNDKMYDLMKWQYTYKQYKLIYTPQVIQTEVSKAELELNKTLNSQKIIDAVNNNAKTTYDRQNEKYLLKKQQIEEKRTEENDMWGVTLTPINRKTVDVFTFPQFYLEAQALLAEELLRYGRDKKKDKYQEEEEQDKELDDLFDALTTA